MSILTELLPKVKTTYKAAAFELEERIRPIFLKYGLYVTTQQLEDALCTVYAIKDKLGNSLIEDDVKIVILEKEESVIPIGGIAVVSLLGSPTISVGNGLKLPKIEDEYYKEALQLLEICPLDVAKQYLKFKNTWLFVVGYDPAICRAAWFRFSNAEQRYVACIAYPGVCEESGMKYISATAQSYSHDKQFTKGSRQINYWYEDKSLEDYWPGTD